MTPIHWSLRLALAAIVIIAGIYDIRWRRIPNWLSALGLLAGLAGSSYLAGLSGLRSSALGLGLAFLIYFPLYLLRAMGAGDVKLMAAVGSMVGAGNWFFVFVFSTAIGAVLALVLLIATGRLRTTLWNIWYILKELIQLRAPHRSREDLDVRSPRAVRLPHGAAIALGCIAWLSISAVLAG